MAQEVNEVIFKLNEEEMEKKKIRKRGCAVLRKV